MHKYRDDYEISPRSVLLLNSAVNFPGFIKNQRLVSGIISTMLLSRYYQRKWKILALTTGKCWALIDSTEFSRYLERSK